MPEHTLAKRLEAVETERRTRTEEQLRLLEETEQATAPAETATEPAPPPQERAGVGEVSFEQEKAIAKLRAQMDATSDPAKKANFKARIDALIAIAEQQRRDAEQAAERAAQRQRRKQ